MDVILEEASCALNSISTSTSLFMLSGSMAYRNIESGSWFLNAIVWTFKYHAHEKDILHLLSKVGLNEFLSNISKLQKYVEIM